MHYRAWTESTQHKFEDTWNEQHPVELVIGKGVCLINCYYFTFYIDHIFFLIYLIFHCGFRSSPSILLALPSSLSFDGYYVTEFCYSIFFTFLKYGI